jgi:hypothetical protein
MIDPNYLVDVDDPKKEEQEPVMDFWQLYADLQPRPDALQYHAA